MNSRIVMAFVFGAVLASGVAWLSVSPSSTPKVIAQSKPLYVDGAQSPAPAPDPPPAPAAEPQAEPEVKTPPPAPEAVHEKPSPLRVRRHPVNTERPVNDAAPAAPAVPPPAPVPAQPQQAAIQQSAPVPAPAPAVTPAIAPAPEPAKVEPPPPPPPPKPHVVTINAGTLLSVRLGETLSTDRNKPGDTFIATLDQPLIVDGLVLAERGAKAEGRVVESDPGGRVRGTAQLGLELTRINSSDGQRINVHTASFAKHAETSRRTDAAKIGAGTVLGAAIGAIAGGGKGAGIGAIVGGAAGAGDVVLTRGHQASLPVETRISFRLQDPVTVTERLR